MHAGLIYRYIYILRKSERYWLCWKWEKTLSMTIPCNMYNTYECVVYIDGKMCLLLLFFLPPQRPLSIATVNPKASSVYKYTYILAYSISCGQKYILRTLYFASKLILSWYWPETHMCFIRERAQPHYIHRPWHAGTPRRVWVRCEASNKLKHRWAGPMETQWNVCVADMGTNCLKQFWCLFLVEPNHIPYLYGTLEPLRYFLYPCTNALCIGSWQKFRSLVFYFNFNTEWWKIGGNYGSFIINSSMETFS